MTGSCPACFKLREISERTPLCVSCVRLVSGKLQAAFAVAYMSGNRAELLRTSAEMITAANNARDVEWQRSRKALQIAGAR